MSRCLVVSASGRRKGNSASLASFLGVQLTSSGADCRVTDMFDHAAADAVSQAQQVFLIAPLYHDTLSYQATRLLEELASSNIRDKSLGVLVHSGYPEAIHRSCAIDICRCFADYQGWYWLGSLSPGLTSVIDRKPLEEAGGLFKRLRSQCAEAAHLWAQGKPIDHKLHKASTKAPIPPRILGMIANWSITQDAKKNKKDVLRKPYGEYVK